MEHPSHTTIPNGGTTTSSSLLLSHSWLAVLMAQRARNSSTALASTSLSSAWAAATALLRDDFALPRRMLVGPTTAASSLRYRPRRRTGVPCNRHRQSTLRYYSRNDSSNIDNGDNATSHQQRQDPSSNDRVKDAAEHTVEPSDVRARDSQQQQPKPAPMMPLRGGYDRVQRQWTEYQVHERMSQVVSKDQDMSSADYSDFEEEKKEKDSSSSEDGSTNALPITIRVPRADKEEADDGSVVSDLSFCDHDDDDDDRDDGHHQGLLGEESAVEARTESPGRRQRKVKISVTGTGQVPPLKPWIVAMEGQVEVHHDPTWGMTTAKIHDQRYCQDDVWPSDEDDNTKTKKTVRDGACGGTVTIKKSSPATTISLSSSSSSSSSSPSIDGYGRRCNHQGPLSPFGAGRNTPECVSPEFQPSRLFRDFRKQHPRPSISFKKHGAATHGRNRHVLVGGDAVLVQVERRQDKSSAQPSSLSPLRAGAGVAAASGARGGTSTVSCA